MIIGIPKEIKNNENRVGITPAGVTLFKINGHEIWVEAGAGLGSGFADLVIKVKEPIPEEYRYFREGLILYTFLHLAPEPELTKQLLEKKVVSIAYETIQLDNGILPLLTPMSEVAGRMSIQIGAQFLEKQYGGKGILLGGVPGVSPANVVIIGGGIVGANAAKIAVGLGACVTVLDVNMDRLRQLDDLFGGRIQTLASNSYNIAQAVKKADLLIGAVLIPGARAPRIVTEEMIKTMQPGSVVVDVAIDQGGSIETIDHITTHSNPTFEKYGVIHYSVANMPGAVARTSTIALANVTIPYGVQLANKGCVKAALASPALAKGINTIQGYLTYEAVANAHDFPYTPIQQVLKDQDESYMNMKYQ